MAKTDSAYYLKIREATVKRIDKIFEEAAKWGLTDEDIRAPFLKLRDTIRHCPKNVRAYCEGYYAAAAKAAKRNKIERDYTDTSPPIGSLWRHYNGVLYEVVQHANVEGGEQYQQHVVYKNANTGRHYTRPLSDWNRSMSLYLGSE